MSSKPQIINVLRELFVNAAGSDRICWWNWQVHCSFLSYMLHACCFKITFQSFSGAPLLYSGVCVVEVDRPERCDHMASSFDWFPCTSIQLYMSGCHFNYCRILVTFYGNGLGLHHMYLTLSLLHIWLVPFFSSYFPYESIWYCSEATARNLMDSGDNST